MYIEHSKLMLNILTLFAELVKRGITFTVRPRDGVVDIVAQFSLSVFSHGEVIQHPVEILDDEEVVYSTRILIDEDGDYGIEYRWQFAGLEWPALP